MAAVKLDVSNSRLFVRMALLSRVSEDVQRLAATNLLRCIIWDPREVKSMHYAVLFCCLRIVTGSKGDCHVCVISRNRMYPVACSLREASDMLCSDFKCEWFWEVDCEVRYIV